MKVSEKNQLSNVLRDTVLKSNFNLFEIDCYLNFNIINENLPDVLESRFALSCPPLRQSGKLIIPDDFPHVGCLGSTFQWSIGNEATITNEEKNKY